MEELTTVPHHDDIASTPYVHYDVYIHFCDYNDFVRDAHTFATELYSRLRSRQLQVFLDVPNLLFEDKIPAKVEEAILAASAHITIFPPNYALSKWCLDKLVLMTKSSAQSRITILPVFYYAKPSELRWTGEGSKGACAEALHDYEKNNRYNSQTIQDWRGALSNVTERSGFVVDDDEEEILDKIVQTILNGFPYGPRYDVFLNHRGPDVKENFARELYSRLTSCGLRVFLDELEFVRGIEITPQIEIAIQFAHVNIAILSRRYAESEWCMEELNLMVTSRATILPVFYQVTHSDLRHGVYDEDLRKHREKGRRNSVTLQNWGDTLSKVAELPDYYELDGNEEELLDNIVKAVSKSVAKRSEHLRTCDVQNVVKSVLKDDAKVEIPSESVLKDDAKVEIPSEVQSSVKLQTAPYQVLKTFASLIYNRLTKCGLGVFLDEKEIRTGDNLSHGIIGAIKVASVHVAIFSQHYAESSWFLEELDWILRSSYEGKAKIVPVFFDVEPKDLRHIESGLYANAFQDHQRKGRVAMEVIQKWKTALNGASMIPGVLFKTDESNHGKILESIVNTVLKEVFKREEIEVAKYPVGLDQVPETVPVVKSVLKDNAKVEITSEVQSSVKLQSFDMQNVVKSVLKNCR